MNDAVISPETENKTEKAGLLTDELGKRSMMRLMSFIALIASVWFGWLTLMVTNENSDMGVYITTAFLLAAFAPKTLQKFIENSYPFKK